MTHTADDFVTGIEFARTISKYFVENRLGTMKIVIDPDYFTKTRTIKFDKDTLALVAHTQNGQAAALRREGRQFMTNVER